MMLLDAHVHFRRCFDWPSFLDSAHTNFEAARPAGVRPTGDVGHCLLFAEEHADDYFQQLRADDEARAGRGWRVDVNDEPESLTCVRTDGARLVLIAGRQIVTRERLEVLALCTRAVLDDGWSLEDTIDSVLEAEAIPVLPWGFGKWWFKRGRRVRELLDSPRAAHVFLGDSRGRPRAAPSPRLLRQARQRGVRVLPGTDPLPLPSHVTRPGRYGFALDADPAAPHPADTIRHALRSLKANPPAFGQPDSWLGFLHSQLALRLPASGRDHP